jgi:hypothetical protein
MLVAPAMSYIAEINNQALGFVEGAKQEAAAAEALYEGIPGIDHDKSDSAEFFEELLVARFEDWATENDKEYESDEEKLFRFSVWVQTDVEIQKHNHKIPPPSFTMGHNQFSDMTSEEFSSIHTGGMPP